MLFRSLFATALLLWAGEDVETALVAWELFWEVTVELEEEGEHGVADFAAGEGG